MEMGKPDQMLNQTSQGKVLVQMDTPKSHENALLQGDKKNDVKLECVLE